MYGKFENEYCNNEQAKFNSFDEAKKECSRLSNCPMLFDNHGDGTLFKICKDPPDRRPSKYNSVLYVKNGKYINLLIALPIGFCYT